MKDNVADKILRLMNTMRGRLEYFEEFGSAVPVQFKHLVFVWYIFHAKLLYLFYKYWDLSTQMAVMKKSFCF